MIPPRFANFSRRILLLFKTGKRKQTEQKWNVRQNEPGMTGQLTVCTQTFSRLNQPFRLAEKKTLQKEEKRQVKVCRYEFLRLPH